MVSDVESDMRRGRAEKDSNIRMTHCARNQYEKPSQWSDVYRPAVHPAFSPGHQDPMLHACNLLHDMTHTPYAYLGVDTIIFKVEET